MFGENCRDRPKGERVADCGRWPRRTALEGSCPRVRRGADASAGSGSGRTAAATTEDGTWCAGRFNGARQWKRDDRGRHGHEVRRGAHGRRSSHEQRRVDEPHEGDDLGRRCRGVRGQRGEHGTTDGEAVTLDVASSCRPTSIGQDSTGDLRRPGSRGGTGGQSLRAAAEEHEFFLPSRFAGDAASQEPSAPSQQVILLGDVASRTHDLTTAIARGEASAVCRLDLRACSQQRSRHRIAVLRTIGHSASNRRFAASIRAAADRRIGRAGPACDGSRVRCALIAAPRRPRRVDSRFG